jgi:catechol 2,3-dioxygenase-like lactoylglutathione lyase family enzyme
MTEESGRVDGIDHVELTVPDRYDAAAWDNETRGLEIVDEFEHWANQSGYPLMISSDGGDTMLAVFAGRRSDGGGGFRCVAVRTTGEDFLPFVDRLASMPEIDACGEAAITDFGRAYAVFFTDPYGHPLEVTTDDYERVSRRLVDD